MNTGDVVRLIGEVGGMTVMLADDPTQIQCVWFEGDTARSMFFGERDLELINGAKRVSPWQVGYHVWLRSGSPMMTVQSATPQEAMVWWSQGRGGIALHEMLTDIDPRLDLTPLRLAAPVSPYPPLGSRVIAIHHPGIWTVIQYEACPSRGTVMGCRSDDGRVMCLGPDEVRPATWRDEKPLF